VAWSPAEGVDGVADILVDEVARLHDEDHAAGPGQHEGRGEAGGAAADDHHVVRVVVACQPGCY
jgi:hypothetical protein